MGIQLIEIVEVGAGGASSIAFSGIPQNGVDLMVKVSARIDTGGTGHFGFRLNGSTSTSHTYAFFAADGSSVFGSNNSSSAYLRATYGGNANNSTANTFSNLDCLIPNYAGLKRKTASIESTVETNSGIPIAIQTGATSPVTAAITSVDLIPEGGNFLQYSTASLYMITAD